MKRRVTAAVALLVATALALTACAAPASSVGEVGLDTVQVPLSELTPLADPRAYQGPSTARLADVEITPIDADRTQQLPVTVVSHDLTGDTEVTITDTSRVIAMDLSGSLAATVWGLGFGDSLIARDVSTTFPGTEDLPVITTGGHTVNAEGIIGLKPTLVLTDGSIGPSDVVAQLRDVGITVVFVEDAASFAGAADLARSVGEAFGTPALGEQLAQRVADEVDATRLQIAAMAPADPADRLRVVFLYLRGTAGVYYLFGKESGADEIIEGLSAIDVAGELGWNGMQPLTDEAWSPLILTSSC